MNSDVGDAEKANLRMGEGGRENSPIGSRTLRDYPEGTGGAWSLKGSGGA